MDDSKGRLIAAFSLNSDLGENWEFLDESRHPVKFSTMGTKSASTTSFTS